MNKKFMIAAAVSTVMSSSFITFEANALECAIAGTSQRIGGQLEEQKIRLRDSGVQYVLLGNSVNVRADTLAGYLVNSTPRVAFEYHEVTMGSDYQYKTSKVDLGTVKAKSYNGHANKSIKFPKIGEFVVVAGQNFVPPTYFFPQYTVEDHVIENATSDRVCANKFYKVHGKPKLTIQSVNKQNVGGGINFSASLVGSWAPYSKAADTHKAISISWYQQDECRAYKWGSICVHKIPEEKYLGTTTNGALKNLSFSNRDPRTIKAVISDGVSRREAHFRVGDFDDGIGFEDF